MCEGTLDEDLAALVTLPALQGSNTPPHVASKRHPSIHACVSDVTQPSASFASALGVGKRSCLAASLVRRSSGGE